LLAKALVLKLGGSLVTDKRGGGGLREEALRRIGAGLATVSGRPLILVHGGGARVHEVAKAQGVALGRSSPGGVEGLVKTAIETRRLNQAVTEILAEAGLRCLGIPSYTVFQTRAGKIVSAELDALFAALDNGLAPVLSGDVVFDRELGFTVLSGDAISVDLAIRLGAERLVFATDVDGVYDQPGGRVLAELNLRRLAAVRFGDVGDVTGGMAAKVEEALRAAEAGVEVMIVNGLHPSRVLDALLGRPTLGTRIIR
jgi:isopentenyl phosphate kinase